jgi:AcrR family transcriptional regulator
MIPGQRGRPRLKPDPQVRAAILDAALAIAHEEGVETFGVAQVLDRAHLSTRAFYRHFESKDDLVTAMFLEVARLEAERLRERIAAKDPVRAVAAWIDRRIDSSFDEPIISSFGHWSLEAHSQFFAAPAVVMPAFSEILRPLINEIDRGMRMGLFIGGKPAEEAISIHGTVWANLERHWATGCFDIDGVRRGILGFCLRGLGVAAEVVDEAVSEITLSRSK